MCVAVAICYAAIAQNWVTTTTVTTYIVGTISVVVYDRTITAVTMV